MKGPKKYLVNNMVPNVQFTLQNILTGLKIIKVNQRELTNESITVNQRELYRT
ncbi:unnamed protein product [Clavelina lepadiformis]|uniref:Uncharacterized protein n=1 Tax=Clavelina lepadiformis TaxID=159417 RepID=A0ABP0GZP2_CLALP